MKMNWLGTAALSFAIGIGANTGAVLAQQHSDSPQKPEQGARSERQSPQSKEMPSTRDERRGGGQSDRTAQDSGREQRRSEGTSRRDQAQEQQSREQQQRQSQDERKSQDERRGREAQQATDQQKRQSAREDQQKQDRAAESAKSSEQKQRQSEQQSQRGERSTGSTQQSQDERKNSQRAGETKQPSGREQAAQPSQQNMTAADRGERETVGRAQDHASGRASMVNDEQRTKVVERLGRERDSWRDTQNLNIRVRVGERLPDRVRPRPLPSDIVRIAPEYRGYDYTMIEDEIAIVDPRSRDIVDVIDERGGRSAGGMRSAEGYTGDRVHYSFSRDEREMLKRAAENSMTVGSTSGAGSGQTCVTMRPIPEELARSRPELASYRYVAIGDQMVLVDPREQKIVEVID
jgi:hypothetical protein